MNECVSSRRESVSILGGVFLSAVLTLLPGCQGGQSNDDSVLERGGALWRADGAGGAVVRLAPAGGFAKAADGHRVCYAFFEAGREQTALCIVECATNGAILREQRFDNEAWVSANAVERATWLAPGRVFVEAHVNPSLGVGIALDLDAHRADAFEGILFAWNPKRTRLAYLREPPHFGAPADAVSALMLGREPVCEVPNCAKAQLLWDSSGLTLAALVPAVNGRPGELIVVRFSDNTPRRVERFTLPPAK